jgi:hypothetical protein
MPDESRISKAPVFGIPEVQRILLSGERVLAVDPRLPVLTVEAPSGFEKTVFAEMWLERCRAAASAAWVTLDSSFPGPVAFIGRPSFVWRQHAPPLGRIDAARRRVRPFHFLRSDRVLRQGRR